MTNGSSGSDPRDREVREALRAAITTPFDDVDWDGLHRRIMADAELHVARATSGAYDWLAAWSSRGIPVAASAFAAAAAVVLLSILPLSRPVEQAAPAGFWPVAQELVSGLSQETRLLLHAAADVDATLTALMVYGREEG